MKMNLEGKEFDILKLRYEDQVALLRKMSEIDLQVFGGYLTLTLGFGAWISDNAPANVLMMCGFLALALSISTAAVVMLHYNFMRRIEVATTVKHLNVALGYETTGLFISDRKINADTRFRAWRTPYFGVIFVTTAGLILIITNA